MSKHERGASGNPDPLRDAIDTGRTGDKVAFPDPAAAPLGTDEEAAGTPVSSRDVEVTIAQETTHSSDPAPASKHGPFAILVSVIVVAAGVIIAAIVFQ